MPHSLASFKQQFERNRKGATMSKDNDKRICTICGDIIEDDPPGTICYACECEEEEYQESLRE